MSRITLARRPSGAPVAEDFRLETSPVPEPGPGEFVVRTIFLSLDPYMRGRMDDVKSYVDPTPLGGVMDGEVAAQVIASRHDGFAVGDVVAARFGWVSHAASDGKGVRKVDPTAARVSTSLGVLGMPGHTAWVGLNDIGEAREGETIVVSAATGAVGSMVCQLASLRGLRVIGVAGGAEKCAWAMEELGCDACVDHRAALDAAALSEEIGRAAPNGIDVYYENVGGKTLEAVLPHMNPHSRIPVCGMISWYSDGGRSSDLKLAPVWRMMLSRKMKVQGFIVSDHMDRRKAFLEEAAPLVRAGRIKYRETMVDGLEAAPEAFMGLLRGENFGKLLVRVSADPA